MNKMTKIAVTAGLALALTVGLGTTAKSAWASYLGTQTVDSTSLTPTIPPSGQFQVEYNTTNGNFYQNYSNASSFGNTIPNPLPTSPIGGTITGFLSANLPSNALFYSASTLDLTPVASLLENYVATGGTGSFSGQLLSQVFKIGSGATMAGANPGELVFTYQFDVTSATTQAGPSQITLAFLNNPSGEGAWLLGGGLNVITSVSGTESLAPIGQTLSGTVGNQFFSGLTGGVQVAANGTIIGENDEWTGGAYGAGQVSPQIFLASNAYSYSYGSFGLEGGGVNGNVMTFVPGTPEPSTLILLGSGLALLAFMAIRRKENGLTI